MNSSIEVAAKRQWKHKLKIWLAVSQSRKDGRGAFAFSTSLKGDVVCATEVTANSEALFIVGVERAVSDFYRDTDPTDDDDFELIVISTGTSLPLYIEEYVPAWMTEKKKKAHQDFDQWRRGFSSTRLGQVAFLPPSNGADAAELSRVQEVALAATKG